MRSFVVVVASIMFTSGCGDDKSDSLGIAAECTAATDCNQDVSPPLVCLTHFKGGYCGLSGCTGDADCPSDARCVTHTDAQNYCFRTCVDKSECNANRTTDNEANCSSNITLVGGGNAKACVPPSG